MENGGIDWVLNHPDYTSDRERERLKKEYEDVERARSQSDQKKELLKNLNSLLVCSGGTNAFKQHLAVLFGSLYDRGVDRSPPEYTVFEILKLEELNNPGSGGIFGGNIEMLEEVAFNHVYLSNLKTHSALDQIEGSAEIASDIAELMGGEKKAIFFEEFVERDNLEVNNWQQQFKDKYKRLPKVV